MWRKTGPMIITLILLAACAVERMNLPGPKDAVPYHTRVKGSVENFPYDFGLWIGQDVEVPPSAVHLLRPNVLLSRLYRNSETGVGVKFLIIQCQDARDMSGHYPPRCYPSSGWTLRSTLPVQWTTEFRTIPGTEYEFYKVLPGRSATLFVSNLFILPDGHLAPDVDVVYELAADYLNRFYGAAQVQMVFAANIAEDERRQIFTSFMEEADTIIEIISSGVEK